MNNELADELSDLVNRHAILRPIPHAQVTQFNLGTVITDFSLAHTMSFSCEMDGYYHWTELRGKIRGQCGRDISREMQSEIFHFTDAVTTRMSKDARKIGRSDIPIISEEVQVDFMIFLYQAENAQVDMHHRKFADLMLSTYKAGLWPCGWKGSWPSGTMQFYAHVEQTVTVTA